LLLRHRGRSGLTQCELADRLGIHRRSVQEWETYLFGFYAILLAAGSSGGC
jgi:helix-turn-helix protein